MNAKDIDLLEKEGHLVKKVSDFFMADSIIKAALRSAEFGKMLPINEKTATGIFRETYEAFRQLGDAKWWLIGYEPKDHIASMRILMSAEIKQGYRLQNLDRFRRIRNDMNYRGYSVKEEQASEIVALWDQTSSELIGWIRKNA